jgi:hypothetical protein
MNKKGIFFSISAVIILILLFLYFSFKGDLQRLNDEQDIKRSQMMVMDNFVISFENFYIEQIIKTAAKNALVKRTNFMPFSRTTKSNIEGIMDDGDDGGFNYMPEIAGTDLNYEQALKTLSFSINPSDRSFDYTLVKARQTNWFTIELNFSVDYSFKVFDSEWSRQNKQVLISFPVYSLWHVNRSLIIDKSWVENMTGCYVNDIISDSIACDKMNIMPNT